MAQTIKNPSANAGIIRDASSVPGSGRSPGEGLQLMPVILPGESRVDTGAWWATVHGVAESQARLSDWTTNRGTDIENGLMDTSGEGEGGTI